MGALSEHEGALRASLQAEYGIRLLARGRTEPERSPFELADLIVGLSPGCALWRATGGVVALSTEALLLRETVYRLELLDMHAHYPKGQQPERIELPTPAHESRVDEAHNARQARARQAREEARARQAARVE